MGWSDSNHPIRGWPSLGDYLARQEPWKTANPWLIEAQKQPAKIKRRKNAMANDKEELSRWLETTKKRIKGHCPACGEGKNAEVVAHHEDRWQNEEGDIWGAGHYHILK